MARAPDFELLKHLASVAGAGTLPGTGTLRGTGSSALATTSSVAAALGISQQSASRRVRALAASGHISAGRTSKGITVALTEKGASELKSVLAELGRILKPKQEKSLTGTVESGLGEGRYYVTRPEYNRQLREFLRSSVYPGTLNLRMPEHELMAFISGLRQHTIKGFRTKERSFGSLKCYLVRVNGRVPAALVLPERSTHDRGTAEIVAEKFLRKELGLSDGSGVSVSAPA